MKKVYIIKGKNEQELADNINGFNKEIFATQPIEKKNGSWVAFVYVNEIESKINNAEELATEKQIYRLKQLGIDFDENITKHEAFEIIKSKSL